MALARQLTSQASLKCRGSRYNRLCRQRIRCGNNCDIAATLGVSRLIVGAPRRNAFQNIMRGNLVRELSNLLPDEIDMLVYA
jgi:hypothetical protein